MSEKRKIILIALAIAALVTAGITLSTTVGTVRAQTSSASPVTKQKEKNLTAGEAEAKRLLLLMDRDQSGKVSKQEFMSFMEEEFQRLDVNKDGELDVKELTQSRLVPHTGVHR
jgi:beta-glucosidase/6-phospho-beta-glucosidase/beta-galactosidase